MEATVSPVLQKRAWRLNGSYCDSCRFQAACVAETTVQPTTVLPHMLTYNCNGGCCGCFTACNVTCSRSGFDMSQCVFPQGPFHCCTPFFRPSLCSVGWIFSSLTQLSTLCLDQHWRYFTRPPHSKIILTTITTIADIFCRRKLSQVA